MGSLSARMCHRLCLVFEIYKEYDLGTSFLAYFPKMKVGLSIHKPVCVSPLITFEPVRGFSLNFGKQVMPLKMTSTSLFKSRIFSHSKMADV
jgi:hypothetical protein